MVRKLLLAASILCAAACAQNARPGSALDVQGTLTLRGNEPFTYPVLSESSGKIWQLVGVDHAAALRLQNRVVRVTGRAQPSAPAALPAIDVESITPADAAGRQ